MASFNRVVLVGNLTRDPELRSTPSGATVAAIGLAVNERRKDQGGSKKRVSSTSTSGTVALKYCATTRPREVLFSLKDVSNRTSGNKTGKNVPKLRSLPIESSYLVRATALTAASINSKEVINNLKAVISSLRADTDVSLNRSVKRPLHKVTAEETLAILRKAPTTFPSDDYSG